MKLVFVMKQCAVLCCVPCCVVCRAVLGHALLLQVRALLTDPAWLEVKLHCYGVAVVVDDFRSYLQVSASTHTHTP